MPEYMRRDVEVAALSVLGTLDLTSDLGQEVASARAVRLVYGSRATWATPLCPRFLRREAGPLSASGILQLASLYLT
jgi:hypothetical protein